MANMRRKSRLTKDKIAQLSLANEVSVGDVRVKDEKEQVESFLLSLKDELMAGIREGIEQEVSISSPAEKSLMEQNSEMISELVGGIEQGINEGLKEYIDNNTRSLKEVLSDVSKNLQGYTDTIKTTSTTIQDTEPKQPPEKKYSSSDTSPTPAEVGEVLKDKPPLYSPKSKGNAGKFITDVMLTSIGLGEYAKIRRNRENEEIPYGKTKAPSSVSEEDQAEALRREETQLDEQVKQTTLLEEIRDLLKEGSSSSSSEQPAVSDTYSGIDIPDFGRNRRRTSRPRPTRVPTRVPPTSAPGTPTSTRVPPTSGVGVAKTVAKTVAKAAAPLSAVFSVGSGVKDLLEGKKVETLGDIMPSDFNVLNPFDYLSLPTDLTMRGGMYIGDKINKGYGAVSEALGGSGSLGSDIYDGVQSVKNFLGFGTPKIEAGKGVFAKNLSEYGNKTTKQDVVQQTVLEQGLQAQQEIARLDKARKDETTKMVSEFGQLEVIGKKEDPFGDLVEVKGYKDPEKQKAYLEMLAKTDSTKAKQVANKAMESREFKDDRKQQIAKQLGISSPTLDSRLEGGVITSINGQEVPTSMLTDYEIERANGARRMRAMNEGVSEDKIKLLKRAEGEVAPTFNLAKPQTLTTATPKPPDVPFDATTVAGETGEFVVPEPVEKKEVNAIPASDLTDPEAAMFEGAKQDTPQPSLWDKAKSVWHQVKGSFTRAPSPSAQISPELLKQAPPMPDVASLQPGERKDLGQGQIASKNKDGTVTLTGGFGSYTYDENGKAIKHESPRFAGLKQSTDLTTGKTTDSLMQGPLSATKGPEGNLDVEYNFGLGVGRVSKKDNNIKGSFKEFSPYKDQSQSEPSYDNMSTPDEQMLAPAMEGSSGQTPSERLRFEVTARKIPKLDSEEPSSKQLADQIAKKIVVNVPPPTVVQQPPPKQTTVEQPFTNNVRNNESSMSRYISSRYAN